MRIIHPAAVSNKYNVSKFSQWKPITVLANMFHVAKFTSIFGGFWILCWLALLHAKSQFSFRRICQILDVGVILYLYFHKDEWDIFQENNIYLVHFAHICWWQCDEMPFSPWPDELSKSRWKKLPIFFQFSTLTSKIILEKLVIFPFFLVVTYYYLRSGIPFQFLTISHKLSILPTSGDSEIVCMRMKYVELVPPFFSIIG